MSREGGDGRTRYHIDKLVLRPEAGIWLPALAFVPQKARQDAYLHAIAPGHIATDNTAALRADPRRNPAILVRIPASRWGEPDDFKGAVVFLASAASDKMHGSIMLVDGGWMGR